MKENRNFFEKLVKSMAGVLLCFFAIPVLAVLPSDTVMAAEDTIWQEDYTYTLDAETGTITLELYNGDATELTVPASATIDGVEYTTTFVVSERLGNTGTDYSIWGAAGNLTELSFESGIVVPERGFRYLFFGCQSLQSVDISNLDTSNATDMSGMFWGCAALENITFGEDFDTSKVERVSYMFADCTALSELDLSGFTVPACIAFDGMFLHCTGLEVIDVSAFSPVYISSVSQMFQGCTNLSGLDWSTLLSAGRVFTDATSLAQIDAPIGLVKDVTLPGTYQDAEGNEYTCLPKNLTESIRLTKVKGEEEFVDPATYYSEVSPLTFEAAVSYLNEIYIEKYPELGLELPYGTEYDNAILQKLADTITKDCDSDAEKALAIAKWVAGNVDTQNESADNYAYAYPIDVFQKRQAACVGFTSLTTQLMRQAGIPAASCSGYFGSMEMLSIDTTLSEGHAWTMAYYDGAWHMFDILWGIWGSIDWDEMAKDYYLSSVEGTCPYYEGRILTRTFEKYANVYIDGHFMNYAFGVPASQYYGTSNTNTMAVISGQNENGAIIVYYTCSSRFFDGSGDSDGGGYADDVNGERKNAMICDECYANGWMTYADTLRSKVRANGVRYTATLSEWNGQLYYIDDGGSIIKIPGSSKDYTMTDGLLTIQVGDSLQITPISSVIAWESSNSEIATIDNDGVITAKAEGVVKFTYSASYGTGSYSFYVTEEIFDDWDYSDRTEQEVPTPTPGVVPTVAPTAAPDTEPTIAPTVAPTAAPDTEPTIAPTVAPTAAPDTEPTIAPTAAPDIMPTSVPDVDEEAREQVTNFATRMYTVVLGREADPVGLNDWTDWLLTHEVDGAGIAYGFIMSEEFTAKNLSDEEYVDVLYSTFFDRTADEGGKNTWMTLLAEGKSRGYVLSGFVNSMEFDSLCDSFGITRGTMTEEGIALNPGIRQFVERCYSTVLGRGGDKDGLDMWTNLIISGEMSAETVAKTFFDSEEFLNKETTDAEYIDILYATFLDRVADDTGRATWTDGLAGGMTRTEVLQGFSQSEEFKGILAGFGL